MKTPDGGSSSDRGDDPKDGDFSSRTTRRKNPTPRKRKTINEMASNGNKRKAGSSSASTKRSRPSLDGTFESSEVDPVGDDDLEAWQDTSSQSMGGT